MIAPITMINTVDLFGGLDVFINNNNERIISINIGDMIIRISRVILYRKLTPVNDELVETTVANLSLVFAEAGLTVESTQGGYMQAYHPKTKQVLRYVN